MRKGGEGEVESDGLVVGESHGFVGQTDIGEGGVEGVMSADRVEFVGVEGGGVEVMRLDQGD